MLRLLKNSQLEEPHLPLVSHRDQDIHEELIASFLTSHNVRGHSKKTMHEYERILRAWFRSFGSDERSLFTFEALQPHSGRQRIKDYCGALVSSGLTTQAIRSYLLCLYQYFEYVLDHPFVEREGKTLDLRELYGDLVQPISKFDMPVHGRDKEMGLPFDPARLYEWFSVIRRCYLTVAKDSLGKALRARNYAMVVLAAESGLRIDELTHLSTDDVFFDSHRVQTRFAKGSGGSGKRSRTTIFPKFARDTIRHYIKHHRPLIPGGKMSKRLFPSVRTGIFNTQHASRIMKPIVECSVANGFPIGDQMSWHWLRRMFATRFIERFPEKLSTLLALMGHSNYATVHRYIKHSEAFMDKEIMTIINKVES